jgi:homoserine O-acetyltransferase
MYVETQYFTIAKYPDSFVLESGRTISPVTLAYESYGVLNGAGDNAILIAQGFTASAHAAGIDRRTGQVGWWDQMIGPGKAFDTDLFFVISINVLGGCSGSTGPASMNPETRRPFGKTFPVVTIFDMVSAQYELLKALGVNSLASVSGASMGGQQVLQWLVTYPDFVRSAIPIACSARLSAMGLAICEVSRTAIISDPDWHDGDYYGKTLPARGLALARMAAQLTYISGDFLDTEFGRNHAVPRKSTQSIGSEFAVQQYLQDEGQAFVKRFDANSFLYLSQAIEHFDLTKGLNCLSDAFAAVTSRVMLISFTTDWLFPVSHVHEVAIAMRDQNVDVSHVTVQTTFGHDAFLTDWQKISPIISEFLS